MLTRCPRCSTTFRVTPEQLKARHGRVRCGHCNDVFNALDTLVEAVPQPAPLAAEQTRIVEKAATTEEVATVEIVANDDFAPIEAAETRPVDASPATITEEADVSRSAAPEDAASEDAAGERAQPAVVRKPEAAATAPTTTESDEPATTPTLEPLLHEAPKPRAWPWALGGAIALFALVAQAAVHYRTELSVLYPSAKPMLNGICAPFGCEVSLPRKPDLVGIEASSLAPEADGKLTLSATLKNRAPFAQQYPGLELTLTDTADKALVRRVLGPSEYLPPKTDIAGGFVAGGEIAVTLSVAAPGLPAVGYQLYLFYP